MGRSESKQAFNDSSKMAGQDQQQAVNDIYGGNDAMNDYKNSVSDFSNLNWNTFKPGGEFMRDATVNATSANAGGQNSLEDYFANAGRRTNTQGNPQTGASEEEASRQGRRDVATALNSADQQRIAALMHGKEYVADYMSRIPGWINQRYGSSIAGANSALGDETNAAKTPGFWDTFLPALIGAGGQVGAGFAGKH